MLDSPYGDELPQRGFDAGEDTYQEWIYNIHGYYDGAKIVGNMELVYWSVASSIRVKHNREKGLHNCTMSL